MNLPGNSAENRLPEQQQNEKTHLKSESIQLDAVYSRIQRYTTQQFFGNFSLQLF